MMPALQAIDQESAVPLAQDRRFMALLDEVKFWCDRVNKDPRFFADIEKLPPSLTLVRRRFYRRDPAEKRTLRNTFSAAVRPNFIKHLGETYGSELAQMGLSNDQIDRMRDFGFFPKMPDGIRMDCSIDHIVGLAHYGTNDFSNLTLIPSKLNALKDQLERMQFKPEDRVRNIITIVPRRINGAYLRVPFISGGFKPRGPQT
jgi:hypothetical protein